MLMKKITVDTMSFSLPVKFSCLSKTPPSPRLQCFSWYLSHGLDYAVFARDVKYIKKLTVKTIQFKNTRSGEYYLFDY